MQDERQDYPRKSPSPWSGEALSNAPGAEHGEKTPTETDEAEEEEEPE